MEMTKITCSDLTPPPTTYTPTCQQEATKKQTQSSDNSKRGPAKRVQYDTKVDALEISNLDNPTQNPTPLVTTSIQHSTPPPAMEMTKITSSDLTPPPPTYTPTCQQEATKKQRQSSDNSKRGPAKRLQYDTKEDSSRKKKQSDSQNEDEA
ncbi:hypothetical protein L1887_23919 [Cichorium endivia]|nr:hypothetical protein L1887_23919 [Cichorium endivia]